MSKCVRNILLIVFITVAAIFISAPLTYMQSFFDGITIWARNILPALFPFTVITTLAFKLSPKFSFSLTKKLFGVQCDGIAVLSAVCGYPIGAKAISDSNADAVSAAKLCSFCSSASPVFILATIGSNILRDVKATAAVFVSQVIALVLNGLAYRGKVSAKSVSHRSADLSAADVGDTITNSALSVISVGGLVAIFYMLTDMVNSLMPQFMRDNIFVAFGIGLLEMTNGIIRISQVTNTFTTAVLSSTLLAFGGICVFLQCYSYLGKIGVKAADIIKMKITQASFATIICFVLCKILNV